MIKLTVDELRVAAVLAGAAVPAVVDQYASADLGADAAAARSLVVRELATPGADDPLAIELGTALRTTLDVLCGPESVLELELEAGPAAMLRCAEVRDSTGRVRGLREGPRDIWCLDDAPGVADALAARRPGATGGGDVVELGLAEHAKLDELLVDRRHDDVRTLLGTRGLFLSEALTDPARTLWRLTRVSRVPGSDDGIAIERIGWVSAPCGTWVVVEADPDNEQPNTTFTPVQPAELTAEIDALLAGALTSPGVAANGW